MRTFILYISFPPWTFYSLKCSDCDNWCGDSNRIKNLPLCCKMISKVSLMKVLLFLIFSKFYCYHVCLCMMWWVHVRGPHVEVRRQLYGVGSLYLYVGSGDQIQVRIIRHHQASQVSLDWGGSSKLPKLSLKPHLLLLFSL